MLKKSSAITAVVTIIIIYYCLHLAACTPWQLHSSRKPLQPKSHGGAIKLIRFIQVMNLSANSRYFWGV